MAVCSHRRYQLHQTDAGHLETVRKSLMSLQLSIQSAVAHSNSQASKLHDNIAKLKKDMDVSVSYSLSVCVGGSLLCCVPSQGTWSLSWLDCPLSLASVMSVLPTSTVVPHCSRGGE